MKQKNWLLAGLAGVLALIVMGGVLRRADFTATDTVAAPVILVDAGHGGEDGGAIGADGTREKHLNLAIARTLADMLRALGFTVRETRSADVMLDSGGRTLRERKVQDMNARLRQIEDASLTVSIHQNQFPQAQYHGAQVFYSGNTEESHLLAEDIRQSLLSVEPGNRRAAKKGGGEIYLLHRATRPAVLVECGFLSNTEELRQLKSPAYQQKIALAIAAAVARFSP